LCPILKYNDYPFLNTLIKDDLSLFSLNELKTLEGKIITKTNNKTAKPTYWVNCIIRNKEIQIKPEEIVRQLYAQKLIEEYEYEKSQIKFEYAVTFGREKKSADIVIFQKNKTEPYIIVELKKAKLKDGKDQLKSYTNATGAPIAIWTNGQQISYYHRKDPNYFEAITDIPKASETLADILNERITIADLIQRDILVNQRKSLKELVLELEDEVLANAGVDVFEELFKLIFAKLYDELQSGRDTKRMLEFRNSGQTESDLKEKIENLFQKAKNKWRGVFSDESQITLTPSHLAICVSSLQDMKLFNSNLEVVDEAFEYLINKSSKGEKGQYFTPRYVIDMCVKMLNPQKEETIIDTAAGSCGFPVHAIFHVWEQILKEHGIEKSHLFTLEQKPAECLEYVQDKVFAIDFDEKAVRVARTLNLIAGDGQTNVIHLNTLDYMRWDNYTKEQSWIDKYNSGWAKLRKLQAEKNSYQNFNFDILIANPPFAGDIKEGQILAGYELGKNAKGKNQTKVGRDILFIERNINFLKPGGRMAIVLPQGRFNNSSDAYIRNFLAERGRILAVVGLHGNVFKPHTGTKTSVLLWQKWTDDKGINPKKEDYPIFFATMQKPSKDNSGDKIYIEIKGENGDKQRDLDNHKHLIVDHDLFNYDGKTQDGIYEAFREFAKRENLSFFFERLERFNEKRYLELLESLEVSEVRLSEMLDAGRMDAEYYKKEYINDKNLILRLPNDKLKNLTKSILSFGAYSLNNFVEYQDSGVPFIRVANMKGGRIDFSDMRYITENTHQLLWKSAVEPETVLVCMAGSIGEIAITSKKLKYPINSNQNIAKIRTNKKLNPYYLYVFLLGRFGENYLKKEERGSVQQQFSIGQIENFDIPLFSDIFQKHIQEIVEKSEDIHTQAQNLYSEAENLLLQELDLEHYQPDSQNIAEVSLSQMLQTGRMDAEYFQPKYAKFVEHLKNYKNGCEVLGELVELVKSVEVGADEYLNENEINSESVPFVRVSDLSPFGLSNGKFISEKTYIKTNTKPNGAFSKKHQPQQGEILLTKDATLGIAYNLAEKPQKMIVSGGILRLINKMYQLNNESLTLILNSKIVKEQINRDAGGSIIAHWRPDQIKETIIPLIPQTLQTQIAQKIQQSHELRKESKRLLEVAKKAVEIAIEQGETEAMEFLKV